MKREKAQARSIKIWKVKSDKSDTAPTYAEVASSSDRPAKSTNKQTDAARKTHKYAKEMLRDADLARQVYNRIQENLTQDFANIQWWSRPEGYLDCSNIADCESTNAIFWCHVCGKACCITCRHQGKACSHDIACYSSELSDFFTPDSIGAPGSTFDIEELIEETLGRTPYFGESKVEQSDYIGRTNTTISCVQPNKEHPFPVTPFSGHISTKASKNSLLRTMSIFQMRLPVGFQHRMNTLY